MNALASLVFDHKTAGPNRLTPLHRYAVGGLSVGEPEEDMYKMMGRIIPQASSALASAIVAGHSVSAYDGRQHGKTAEFVPAKISWDGQHVHQKLRRVMQQARHACVRAQRSRFRVCVFTGAGHDHITDLI